VRAVLSVSRSLVAAVCLTAALACSALLGNGDVTFAQDSKNDASATRGAALPSGLRFLTRLPPPAPRGQFGASMALSGHTLAVAAPFEDLTSEAGVRAKAGATYLFDLSVSPPSYERIVAFNAHPGDGLVPRDLVAKGVQQADFDWPVLTLALSDATLVVGAPAEGSASQSNPSDNSAPYSGAVYVYDRTQPGSAPQYIKAPNAEARDLFGRSVSLSSSWLAIGAPRESSSTAQDWSDNSAPDSGAVFVYHRDPGKPFDESPIYVKSPAIAPEASFGTTVAVTEDLLVVGAPTDGQGGADVGDRVSSLVTRSGTLYIYRWSGTGWVPEHTVKATKAQLEGGFATAVSPLSAGAFAVGAPTASGCNGPVDTPTYQGAAYLLQEDPDGGWRESCVEPTVASKRLFFGLSVGALDGRLVVGAPWDSQGLTGSTTDLIPLSGSAYVYEHVNSGLSGHYFKAPNPQWAGFGYALCLAPGYLVVGAANEYDPPRARDAGPPASDEPPPSGAVYVYAFDN
jgi:hypothetical protein